jgi:hypothetical protein
VPVEDDIVTPAHTGETVDPKADRLVEAGKGVERRDRQDDDIDEGRREHGHDARSKEIAVQPDLQRLLPFADAARNHDPALAHAIAQGATPFGQPVFQLSLEGTNSGNQVVDLGSHGDLRSRAARMIARSGRPV